MFIDFTTHRSQLSCSVASPAFQSACWSVQSYADANPFKISAPELAICSRELVINVDHPFRLINYSIYFLLPSIRIILKDILSSISCNLHIDLQ